MCQRSIHKALATHGLRNAGLEGHLTTYYFSCLRTF